MAQVVAVVEEEALVLVPVRVLDRLLIPVPVLVLVLVSVPAKVHRRTIQLAALRLVVLPLAAKRTF